MRGDERIVELAVLAEDSRVDVEYWHSRRRGRGHVLHGDAPQTGLELHHPRMGNAGAVQLAAGAAQQHVRRLVVASAFYLDGQVLNVVRLRIVAAQCLSTADQVDAA